MVASSTPEKPLFGTQDVQAMLSIQTIPTGSAHHTVFFAAVALLILAALSLLRLYSLHLRRALVPRRPGHTEDSFVHHMASIGLNPRIARTTYRYLQKKRNIRFPILIADSLHHDLGLDQRAVIETIRTLLLDNGREAALNYARTSIVTVGDLVGFIQSSPRAEMDLAA